MSKNKGMVAGQGKAKTAAPSKQAFTVKMKFKKDTPGTFVYEAEVAEGEKVAVRSLYVGKDFAAKQYAEAEVTVVLK